MNERIDYLVKDNFCWQAIEDFKNLHSVPDWLNQHAALYNSVSIKPEGLPRITSAHMDEEKFENISRFAHLFETVNALYEL